MNATLTRVGEAEGDVSSIRERREKRTSMSKNALDDNRACRPEAGDSL